MPTARKIILYTHAMSGGGAERVCALLASGFARAGCEVILATDFAAPDNQNFVDALVRQVPLGSGHVANVWALARLLRREKPDVAMSALGISNLKLTLAALVAGTLGRTILSYHGFGRAEPQFLSRLSYLLTPALTRLTAATVCVSDALRDDLVSRWRASKDRTIRIYNPVAVRLAHVPHSRRPMVLAVGRLNREKNVCGLVRAFALMKHANATLLILGEGEERPAIEAEVARLGLQGRVSLPGYASEPWAAYAEASCLAVSSRSETFSLVVVEALANGLPVVSTACMGPEEILDHGRFGTIVPYDDARAMAAALDACLDNPGDPAPRKARAAEFSVAVALASYGRLFDRVSGSAKR